MIRRSVEWFLGSVVVYVLTAACAATGGIDSMMDMASGGLTAMLGGNTGSGAVGTDGQGAESSGAQASDGSGAIGSDGEGATGGTSIVNLYRTTADGLKTSEGYFDKDLEVACSFGRSGDGVERCLPVNTSGMSANYFTDSGCTQPLGAIAKTTCLAGAYATSLVYDTTCTGASLFYHLDVYQIGSKISDPTAYSGTPDSCTEVSDSFYETYDFYAVTKVDPTTFAEGALVQGSE